jgi:hypothetical protein
MAQSPRIRVFNDFAGLRLAAPGLGNENADGDVFCTLEWFENLARHGFDPEAELMLMLVDGAEATDDRPALCLPLVSRNSERQIASLSNFYSSLFGPIGNALAIAAADWRALLDHLLPSSGPTHRIDLNPLDPDSAFFARIFAALRARGWWADDYFCFGNWYLKLGGRSFEAYFAGLPAALRNTIGRGRKKLAGAGDWQVVIHQHAGAELDQAIADFKTVYAQSWKEPETHPHFIEQLCRMAAGKGWLRLGVLRLDQKPIAAQLWLTHGRRALIYKLAYDAAYPRLSAGSVLTAAMMQNAIDRDRVSEVDYLTGDDVYKRDWMSDRRERRGIVAFNPRRLRGVLAAGRHFLPKWVKRFGRRSGDPSVPAPERAR